MHPQLMHCSHECPQLRSSRGQSNRAPQMAQLAASISAKVAASASASTLAPPRPAIYLGRCLCMSKFNAEYELCRLAKRKAATATAAAAVASRCQPLSRPHTSAAPLNCVAVCAPAPLQHRFEW